MRDPGKADHHRQRGIDVRRGDFDDPEAMRNAFAGTEHLLIISTDKIGQRVEQHRRAVQAALATGVEHVLYTSIVVMGSGETTSPIAMDHRATEQMIRETGMPYTILRNTFYAEYMLFPVVQALGSGVFVSSVGDGRLGSAARTDLAEAAAVALSEPGHENITYELTYPRTWDYTEAVEIISRVSGKPLVYRPASEDEMASHLRLSGTPEESIPMALGMDRTLREGHLSKAAHDLEQVLGRPVTPLEEVARQLLSM